MKNTLFITLFMATLTACNPSKNCVEHQNPDCMCTMQYDPVCGCNNKTYSNACAAGCAGIKTFTKGECNAKLEGMVWQVTDFVVGTAPQPVPDSITISIKFEGGKITGYGGCNSVMGSYIAKGNSLTVQGLASTKMYCESAMQWETMFLDWFAKSQSYSITGERMEIDCGDKGKLLFRLNWKKRNGG